MTSAASVGASTVPIHGTGPGASPRAALQSRGLLKPKDIVVVLISNIVARSLCRRHHYSRSYPGGSLLNFGMLVGKQLLGVAVLGVGPTNVHRFFKGAQPSEVVCLTRFWLDDRLGRNAERQGLRHRPAPPATAPVAS